MTARIKLSAVLVGSIAVVFFTLPAIETPTTGQGTATPALAGFDNQTNGFESQTLFDAGPRTV